jgi:phage shock protein C
MTQKRKAQLYKDPINGKFAGICAGLADYFGWETWLVRVLVVSATLFGMQFLILLYIAGWFILDKKPKQAKCFTSDNNSSSKDYSESKSNNDFTDESIKVKGKVWQAGEPPKQALYDIKRKFTLLEGKLRTMEHYVTSPEYTLSREINKL